MKINLFGKIIIGLGITGCIAAGGVTALYLKGLPYIVSHPKTIKYAQTLTKKYTGADLTIESPNLHTELSPKIGFTVKEVYLSKSGKKILELNNFNTEISFREILKKNVIIKKLVARNIYADVNELETLIPKNEQKPQQKRDWNIDIFEALLGVRDCDIIYKVQPNTIVTLHGHNIGINNAQKIKKNVYFQLLAKINRNGKVVTLKLNDNEKVFFSGDKFHIENCPLSINKSHIFINFLADRKQNFDASLYSKNLNLNDIIDFLNTQIIENNINETLAYFSDLQGFFDFNLHLTNKTMNGDIKLNSLKFKVIPVDNLPVALTKGHINLTSNEIKLDNFEGYYDNNPKNTMDFAGTVKDYLKSVDIDIVGNALARNDFFKTHLSNMAGTQLELNGESKTRVKLKSKNNIIDVVWYFVLKPGQNIKVAGDFLPFEKTLRAMKSDIHFENMVLDIKSLDYYIIPAEKLADKQKLRENKPQPIFKLSSSIDLAKNNHVKFIGFEIPNPLPSEILNAVLQQKIFKKGKISGKLKLDNMGAYPVINGSMNIEKVLIPSQRLFIKNASLSTSDNLIHLNADGGFRRSKYKFNGDILNEIRFPLIVKDVNLSLENLDLLKLMEASSNPSTSDNEIVTDNGTIQTDGADDFDIGNIIIEKCRFHLDKGSYKDITFGNIDADLTLNKDSILDIKSNRFDFADGHSSLKVNCDLKNKKYNVKLGILDVESDIIAKTLLNLEKEITGKASGIMDLYTDETLKLSGTIKFRILNGTIEKIGLVEYILKFAALFRNPITMISPGMFADIVNIPEGTFDKITGSIELDKNIAKRIKIKSYSPQLSTYIAGRYNLENGDTSLRIYTKFSNAKKGIGGFFRNISLNALANRIPLSSRNDTNYYSSELQELPNIDAPEKDCQVFLTKVEGDVGMNNYISILKKLR